MTEQVGIQFGASAAGVQEVTGQIIGDLLGMREGVQALNERMVLMTEVMMTGFSQLHQDLTRTNADLQKTQVEAEKAGLSLKVAADGAKERWEAFTGVVGKLNAIMLGAMAVLAGGEIFDKAIEATTKYTGEVVKLAKAFGITLHEADGMHAALTKFGIGTDQASDAAAKMIRQMRQHEDAFNRLGIVTREANGHFRNMQDIFLDGLDSLRNYQEGVDRTAASQVLFGRGAGDVNQLLKLNRQEMEEGARAAKELGLQTTSEGVTAMREYKVAVNETKEVMEALEITIGRELLPYLTQLGQWLRSEGPAAIHQTVSTMADLIATVKTTGAEINMIPLAFGVVLAGLDSFWTYFKTTMESIERRIEVTVAKISLAGQAMQLAIAGNWSMAHDVWSQGLSAIESMSSRTAAAISADWDRARAHVAAATAAMRNAMLADGGTGPDNIIIPGVDDVLPSSGGGRRLDDIKQGHDPKEKKGGKGPSIVAQWEEELHRAEIVSGDFFKDQTEKELAFWQSKVGLVTAGSKEWLQVQDKIFQASKKLAQERLQEQLSEIDYEIAKNRDNFAEQERLEAQKVELARVTYGETSRQYKEALREQERMAHAHEAELARIEQTAQQNRLAARRDALKAELDVQNAAFSQIDAAITYTENAGLMSRRAAAEARRSLLEQEYQAKLREEELEYQATVASMRDQLKIKGLALPEQQRLNAEIEKEVSAHNNRLSVMAAQQSAQMAQANLRVADAIRQTWLTRVQAISGPLTQMVNGFLTHTMTLRDAVLSMGSQILQAVNQWLMKWVTEHVAAEHAKTAASVAGNAARTSAEVTANATGVAMNAASATSEITTHGAVAAAGALRAISHIPVIGPFIAPAIAAGIMALAMSFISKIASAEGGWDRVPADGMMTELHKDEMVLPASIASPLRSLLDMGYGWSLGATGLAMRQSDGAGPGGAAGDGPRAREGDVHLHLHAMDGRSAKRFLMDHRSSLADVLRSAARDGV